MYLVAYEWAKTKVLSFRYYPYTVQIVGVSAEILWLRFIKTSYYQYTNNRYSVWSNLDRLNVTIILLINSDINVSTDTRCQSIAWQLKEYNVLLITERLTAWRDMVVDVKDGNRILINANCQLKTFTAKR